MRLNRERVARYLEQSKKLNDYLLKINSKNRIAMLKLAEARYHFVKGEEFLRELLNLVAKEKVDG